MKKFKHPSNMIPLSHKEYVMNNHVVKREKYEDFINRIINSENRFIPKYLIPSLPVYEIRGNTRYQTLEEFKLEDEQNMMNSVKEKKFYEDVWQANNLFKPCKSLEIIDEFISINLNDSLTNGGPELLHWLTSDPHALELEIHSDNRINFPPEVIALMKRLEYPFLKATFYELRERFLRQINPHLYPQKAKNIVTNVNDSRRKKDKTTEFSGTYASDVAGFSDNDIYDAFEGDPDNYWNID